MTDDRLGQAYADVLRMRTLTYDVCAGRRGAALVHASAAEAGTNSLTVSINTKKMY